METLLAVICALIVFGSGFVSGWAATAGCHHRAVAEVYSKQLEILRADHQPTAEEINLLWQEEVDLYMDKLRPWSAATELWRQHR